MKACAPRDDFDSYRSAAALARMMPKRHGTIGALGNVVVAVHHVTNAVVIVLRNADVF